MALDSPEHQETGSSVWGKVTGGMYNPRLDVGLRVGSTCRRPEMPIVPWLCPSPCSHQPCTAQAGGFPSYTSRSSCPKYRLQPYLGLLSE